MLFDTHAHPYLSFKKSPETILEHFFWDERNICISIGCDIESSEKSIALSKKYPWKLFASIGFHPCDLDWYQYPKGVVADIEKLYERNKEYIVAIWEIGLDYYHLYHLSESSWYSESEIKEIQKTYFREQIRLAKKLNLPFIIHSRESNEEVLEILREENTENYVFHSFSWDWDFAQRVLAQNPEAMFGFGGIMTFKKSQDLQEVVKNLPLKHILIETDSPFLTPEPLRGREENEPEFVKYVLKKIQELREEAPEEIEKILYENGKKFFWL